MTYAHVLEVGISETMNFVKHVILCMAISIGNNENKVIIIVIILHG